MSLALWSWLHSNMVASRCFTFAPERLIGILWVRHRNLFRLLCVVFSIGDCDDLSRGLQNKKNVKYCENVGVGIHVLRSKGWIPERGSCCWTLRKKKERDWDKLRKAQLDEKDAAFVIRFLLLLQIGYSDFALPNADASETGSFDSSMATYYLNGVSEEKSVFACNGAWNLDLLLSCMSHFSFSHCRLQLPVVCGWRTKKVQFLREAFGTWAWKCFCVATAAFRTSSNYDVVAGAVLLKHSFEMRTLCRSCESSVRNAGKEFWFRSATLFGDRVCPSSRKRLVKLWTFR